MAFGSRLNRLSYLLHKRTNPAQIHISIYKSCGHLRTLKSLAEWQTTELRLIMMLPWSASIIIELWSDFVDAAPAHTWWFSAADMSTLSSRSLRCKSPNKNPVHHQASTSFEAQRFARILGHFDKYWFDGITCKFFVFVMDFHFSHRAERGYLLNVTKIHCLTWLTLKHSSMETR